MRWWGKIIGGSVGLAVGGPAGAILGAGLGAVADMSVDDQPYKGLPELDIEARFIDDDFGRHCQLFFQQGVPKGAAMIACIHDRRGRTLRAVSAFAQNGNFVVNRAIERGRAEFYVPFSALRYRREDHYTLSVTVLFMDPGADKATTVGHKPFDFDLPKPSSWSKVAFLQPLMGLCMAVTRANGKVSPRAVRIVKKFFTSSFDIPITQTFALRDMMKTEPSEDLRILAQGTQRRMPALSPMQVLELLTEVARCDGPATKQDRDIIREISIYLGIPENRWREVEKKLGLLIRPANPWEILGIRPGSSDEEIKVAYRAKLSGLHPDKVARMDKEIQDLAQDRTIELRRAYESVMDDRA